MPYEYRKLSPKERKEIIEYRGSNGHPLHAPPHPFRGPGAYLTSVSNFEQRAIMRSPARRTNFETRLLNCIEGIAEDLTGKRRVWYRFADAYVRNDAHLHLAFNYIHYNPVKHGYVVDPLDWPWSSLRMYYENRGRDWLQEQWNTYEPPADFGNGWDDDIGNN